MSADPCLSPGASRHNQPVHLVALLQHVVPVSLIAAVSPVLFLNALRATEGGGRAAGLRFLAGAGVVLLAVGIAMMGVIGASAATFVSAELASDWVDTALAVVLIGYGLWQLRAPRSTPTAAKAPGPSGHDRGAFGAGVLGMITNFTTLPLYLSVAQRTGAADIGVPLQIIVLVSCTALVLAPTWLPLVLPRGQGKVRLSPHIRHRIQELTHAVSVGACLLGGALILWHAWA